MQIERNFLIRMWFFVTQSFATLDLLQIDLISNVLIFYCLFVIKSFDLEGWVVGVAVSYTSNILQTNRRDIPQSMRIMSTSTNYLQRCFPADPHVET